MKEKTELPAGTEVEVITPDTISVKYKISFSTDSAISGLRDYYLYSVMTGVPKDLPKEAEAALQRTAEGQFIDALNNKKFIGVYVAENGNMLLLNTKYLFGVRILSVQRVTDSK